MQNTVYGRITRDVNISGTPVLEGSVVEVDHATFRDLRRNGQIVECAPPKGAEEKKREPMLAFRLVSKPPAEK